MKQQKPNSWISFCPNGCFEIAGTKTKKKGKPIEHLISTSKTDQNFGSPCLIKTNRFHFDFILLTYKSAQTSSRKLMLTIITPDQLYLGNVFLNSQEGKLCGDGMQDRNIKSAICSCANVTLIVFASGMRVYGRLH